MNGKANRSVSSQLNGHFVWFLLAVFAVRGVHLALLGTIGTGMNQAMAVEAKQLLTCGLGHAFTDKPPGATLPLAAVAFLLSMVPGDAIYVLNLLVHLVFAAAFWIWVRRLELRPATRSASLLFFLALPLLNGYDGFDNYPTLLAAAAFLLLAASLPKAEYPVSPNPSGDVDAGGTTPSPRWQGGGPGCLLAVGVFAWFVMLVRIEYLVLVPWYLVLLGGLSWLLHRVMPGRRDWLAAAAAVAGLCVGAASTKAFRYADAGDFALAPNTYGCITFLQGTPEAWLQPEDKGDWGRYHRGVQYFGDPADYDYSVLRMMRHHPVRTVQKALLNVPTWLFHLGRRHVVVPLPITAIALIGAAVFARCRARSRWKRPFPMLLATILMTLPLVVTSVWAEYMMPAYAAMVVLAAQGAHWCSVQMAAWVRTRVRVRRLHRVAWYSTIAACFVIMEGCYFRGGGHLPDATDLRPVAEVVDQIVAPTGGRPILLDPPSDNVDMFSRSDIRNRWLSYKWLRRLGGPAGSPTLLELTPRELADSPAARSLPLDCVIVWISEDKRSDSRKLHNGTGMPSSHGPRGAPPLLQDPRLGPWEAAGFQLVESRETRPDGSGKTYRVFKLER